MTAESKTAAAARGAVRIWTEEEKDLVWEETWKARRKTCPDRSLSALCCCPSPL